MIYFGYMLFLVLYGVLCHIDSNVNSCPKGQGTQRSHASRNFWYCVIAGGGLFLLAALRSPYVGFDTRTYLGHFSKLQFMGFNMIFHRYGEKGFYILLKLLSLVTTNGQWVLALTGGIYAFCISHFIYHNSNDYLISYLSLIPFMFFAFSLTGMRQTIAMAIVVFLGFESVKQRKLWRYLIFVAVAMLFHFSALFALPIYFLYSVKISPKQRFFFFAFLPVFFVLRPFILRFFMKWFYSDYMIFSGKTSWAMAFVLFLIWIIYVLVCQSNWGRRLSPSHEMVQDMKDDAGGKSALAISNDGQNVEAIFLIGFLIQLFVPFNPNIFRLALYYQIFILILVPQIVIAAQFTLQSRRIYKTAWVVLMFVMYMGFTFTAAGQNPYLFFWE